MLTSEAKDLKRFLLSSPEESVSEAERAEREAYHYKKVRPNLKKVWLTLLFVDWFYASSFSTGLLPP